MNKSLIKKIYYVKKSNGKGPNVFESLNSWSYWHVIKMPSPRPFSDLTKTLPVFWLPFKKTLPSAWRESKFSNLIEDYWLATDCNASIALVAQGAIIPIVIQSALRILASSSSNSFFNWILLSWGAVLKLFRSTNFFISIN